MGVDDIDVDERFDTVAALAVIEHVSEPEAWLRRWSAHVRPGGHVVLTTPHARWEPLVGLTSKVKLTNVGTDHGHETAFDRRSLHATVEAAGLRPTLYRTFLGGMNQLLVAER
jgi:2-polyprenyl-3-methyl-5-hydroxy-6-metoxy-1,4-benzoquinol methylase